MNKIKFNNLDFSGSGHAFVELCGSPIDDVPFGSTYLFENYAHKRHLLFVPKRNKNTFRLKYKFNVL